MARHDFWCSACGQLLADVNVPIAIGATAGAPEHCGKKTVPIPGIGRMDVGGVKGASFQKFEVYNHRNELVTVDSVHKLRQVERESEQAARNGEGQPLRFRMWSQDRTNRDVNTFGEPPSEKPDPAFVKKFGKAIRSATEPEAAFGPGVNESNTSALPMAGG
jgi:hypothetical protein